MILYLLMATVLIGFLRGVDLFDTFAEGAKEGLTSAVSILPCLTATLVGLRVMEKSGALVAICDALTPLGDALQLPSEVLPLFILRPLSGSASLALLSQILEEYGPDSRIGLIASTMMGSGETVFYTCALYLSAAGVKKSRYIIPASLAGWVVGCIVSARFFP